MTSQDRKEKKEYYCWIPNLINKPYIDDWVSRNYQTLFDKFWKYRYRINKNAYSPVDIFQESIMRIYVDKKHEFHSQEECDRILNKYFKIQFENGKKNAQCRVHEDPHKLPLSYAEEETDEGTSDM